MLSVDPAHRVELLLEKERIKQEKIRHMQRNEEERTNEKETKGKMEPQRKGYNPPASKASREAANITESKI